MDRIGEHYTAPKKIWTASGLITVQRDTELETTQVCYCQGLLHYGREHNPIPSNTKVRVNYTWGNLYGSYCNVSYECETYDVKPEYLKLTNS